MLHNSPVTYSDDSVIKAVLTSRTVLATLGLLVAWFLLLALFFSLPQIDIAITRSFFVEATCPSTAAADAICGSFPFSRDAVLIFLRKVLFYLPSVTALGLLWLLIDALQHHGATYDAAKVRRLSLSLLALALGPYVLVNLLLKSYSGRPRPYETDLFGGSLPFAPAGSFAGDCANNCSFISGEAAGAGWLVCLIPLLPKTLRPLLAPPIVAVCIATPALRLSFGGHYLSDVVLGWLSSLVVYGAVFATSDLLALRKKRVRR